MTKLFALFLVSILSACMVPPADATGDVTGTFEAAPIAVHSRGTDVMCAYDGTELTLHLTSGTTTFNVTGTPATVTSHFHDPSVDQWFDISTATTRLDVIRNGDDITVHLEGGSYPDQATNPHHPLMADITVHGCL
jgi:hypothetical protein